MKKLLTICFAVFGLMLTSAASAQDYSSGQGYAADQGGAGSWGQGGAGSWGQGQQRWGQDQQQGCCAPADKACGGYQLICHYEPCYYNEYYTVCCPKVCQKKCCRYVPQAYEKCCVKYVPQYYTQTCYRQVPQYYNVDYTVNEYKKECVQKCKYVPKYSYRPFSGGVVGADEAGACCGAGACSQ